ncbi:MAG: formyltetrahydrofolate deformylase [Candidatus Omnitrophica bacterium]|nr:formyltetrahydrofolate deformylase [Candidatus Omnitrophota bacterium]MDD5081304.1 formyltetrahydrofolate deformylase [Candidatus Omnitrophota bacterium]MDD5440784.1 formyltetrahydrofolate deformylase [Candidatus Omnitrophota bacterium]
MYNAICLISCPDRKGLVAKITDFISSNNGNIEHLDQHIDPQSKTFFMRVEWAMDDFNISRNDLDKSFSCIASELGMNYKIYFTDGKPRIAIFVSKLSHCLYDILLRVKSGEYNCDVPLIVSDHTECQSIAESFDIPFYHLPKNSSNISNVEEQELDLLRQYDIDFLVLARYMKIFSDRFVNEFENRMINIHHSFLPAFAGKSPYSQAHARGVKIIGATSHYVTEQLDSGPIIEQDIVRINHSDDVETLRCKGRDLERIVLSRAVRLHLAKKVLVYGNKTVVFD